MSDDFFDTTESPYHKYGFYFFLFVLFLALIIFLGIVLYMYIYHNGGGRRNCRFISRFVKVLAVLILFALVPFMLYDFSPDYDVEYLAPFGYVCGAIFCFFVKEHFVFRFIAWLFMGVTVFYETYNFHYNMWRLNIIYMGMYDQQSEDENIYYFLYFRSLLVIWMLNMNYYMIIYLMIALGFVTDETSYTIRDLDDYDVNRPKNMTIYDFIRTSRPYYMSLKENVDPEARKKRMRQKIIKKRAKQREVAPAKQD